MILSDTFSIFGVSGFCEAVGSLGAVRMSMLISVFLHTACLTSGATKLKRSSSRMATKIISARCHG